MAKLLFNIAVRDGARELVEAMDNGANVMPLMDKKARHIAKCSRYPLWIAEMQLKARFNELCNAREAENNG